MTHKNLIIKDVDLIWLAGILEGDGFFSTRKDSPIPIISIQLNDEDVIKKISSMFGVNYYKKSSCNIKWSDSFYCVITSVTAESLCRIIEPYMGCRRKSRINSMLQNLNAHLADHGCSDLSSYLIKTVAGTKGNIYRNLYQKREVFIEENKIKSIAELSRQYKVSHPTISKIIKGVAPNKLIPTKTTKISIINESTQEDLNKYYIAGLLEAEGSFMKGPPSKSNCPRITIQMTDKDVIEKVCSILESSCFSWRRPGKTKSGNAYKEVHITSLRGGRALKWMEALHPLMGVRRKNQIVRALESYDPNKVKNMSRQNKVISEKEIKKIINMYHDGLSFRKIAKIFNVSHRTIERVIKIEI